MMTGLNQFITSSQNLTIAKKKSTEEIKQQECQSNIEYKMQPINTTHSYKYLGVQLDPLVNTKEHFKGVCKKVSTRIRLLKRIRPFLTDLATLRMYQALTLSQPLLTVRSQSSIINPTGNTQYCYLTLVLVN